MKELSTLDWLVVDQEFPASGTAEEKLVFLVRYTELAPSVRNSRPWLFEVKDGAAHVRADMTRALPHTDPEHRELIISCGAAVHRLREAARHFGHDVHVVSFPQEHPGVLATIRLAGRHQQDEMDMILFYAIHKTSSSKMPFRTHRKVPEELLEDLMSMGNAGGTWLRLVQKDTPSRRTVAGLVAEGDESQMKDAAFRRELAEWISPRNTRNHHYGKGFVDGVSRIATHVESILLRTFERGKSLGAQGQKLAESAPVVAVLGTHDDSPASWLEVGQAMSVILLRAVAVGVHAAFLNQPVQVPELRGRLAATLGADGHAQLMFCLGYTESPDHLRPASELVRQSFL